MAGAGTIRGIARQRVELTSTEVAMMAWAKSVCAVCLRPAFAEGAKVLHWDPSIDMTQNPAYHEGRAF